MSPRAPQRPSPQRNCPGSVVTKPDNPPDLCLEQLPLCDPKGCPWHRGHPEGKVYGIEEIFPQGVCPWLYHTVYPYFLGLYYGARFDWNEQGDCNVCCPAAAGVDVIVRKRDNDGTFDPRIDASMKFVIFAEVVKVRGACPHGHRVGQRIPFPTCMVKHFMCPAALHNVFPLLRIAPPECISLESMRCPDWNDVISFRKHGSG